MPIADGFSLTPCRTRLLRAIRSLHHHRRSRPLSEPCLRISHTRFLIVTST